MLRAVACRRSGLTLVEVLVVVAIVGLLVGLLMPSLAAARESSRRNTCSNNLRQMGQAALLHLEQLGTFPSGGWTGAPAFAVSGSRGFHELQGGGWAYNLLPFIELGDLRNVASSQVSGTCPAVFSCPTTSSRRWVEATAYSGCGGNPVPTGGNRYPKNYCKDAEGNSVPFADIENRSRDSQEIVRQQCCGYPFVVAGLPHVPVGSSPSVSDPNWFAVGAIDGVIGLFGRVRAAHVRDGMSQTLLIAERENSDAGCGTNSRPWLSGFDWWSIKFTNHAPRLTLNTATGCLMAFGSRHADSFGAVMCDGSVRRVTYAVDPAVFRSAGSRSGGDIGNLDN
jgi:prepilin-type N-terminal cleavage/methylation domain-containing protein